MKRETCSAPICYRKLLSVKGGEFGCRNRATGRAVPNTGQRADCARFPRFLPGSRQNQDADREIATALANP
jgi:hypothetical protein